MPNTTDTLRALKSVTFASQNLRSMYPKMDEIKQFLRKTDLDFLLIQESFLNDRTPDALIEIDNYKLHRLDRDTLVCKKSGGGLVTYSSDKYEVDFMEEWSSSTSDLEILWTKLKLPHTRPTYVANVYRPPAGDVNVALNTLDNRILKINMNGTADILVMGDLNINLNCNELPTRKLRSAMRDNLLQLIKQPTRATITSKMVIEHIWVLNQDFYNKWD